MENKRIIFAVKIYPETKEWLESIKEANPDATWDMVFQALKDRVPLSPKPQCKSTSKAYTLKQQIVYPSNTAVTHKRVSIEQAIEALSRTETP